MRVVRVGGVAEPFNLPWIHAFEDQAFAPLGVEVTFTEFAGGTGALVAALEDQEIDLATLLTEGAITAMGRWRGIELHSAFTTTPLRWGIHVAGDRAGTQVDDLEGERFAISRHGSGSELMAYVLAAKHGWTLNAEHFVEVGGIDGAIEALPENDAEIFLWERFVTAPLVERQIFARIGELPTPWPAFYTAARAGLLGRNRSLIDEIAAVVLHYGARLLDDAAGTVEVIVDRYGMSESDASTWLAEVQWAPEPFLDRDVLAGVGAQMVELGRIEAAPRF